MEILPTLSAIVIFILGTITLAFGKGYTLSQIFDMVMAGAFSTPGDKHKSKKPHNQKLVIIGWSLTIIGAISFIYQLLG